MKDIREKLPALPFWDKLSRSEQEFAERSAVMRGCESGEIISGRDTACLGMTLVLSGELRVYILSEEGREITLFRLSEGDVCVLSASCIISQITFDTHIVAENATEILVLSSDAFSSLVDKNIYARCFMYEKMSEHFSAVMWSMQQILFMRFDRRLASFLLSECERTGTQEINMTHEQIAQHVNSAREVVARMLKRFVSEGFVELRRGSILITDKSKLDDLLTS